MNYEILRDVINLIEDFDSNQSTNYSSDISGFKQWITDSYQGEEYVLVEPSWEGKENGRSAESIINTLIVHMNRYAKSYSKSAVHDSHFSSQEDFIYLINLRAFGSMTKTELIKKNIHEKPVGMQIINRLLKHGWVIQDESLDDKRSKIITISETGIQILDENMENIRKASEIVTGHLNQVEKMQLIKLLQKLDHFHRPLYAKNLESPELIDIAYAAYQNRE